MVAGVATECIRITGQPAAATTPAIAGSNRSAVTSLTQAARIAVAEAAGVARDCIAVDPGIGFGKTLAHNLALLARLSLFHDLGVPVLLGASRKRMIGEVAREGDAGRRMPGSLAVALAGVAQGIQMIRVHDVPETRQALSLWQAVTVGDVR